MGLGDFFEDVGGAVADTATGLYHGAEAVVGTAGDIAQGAAWVANPTHWDDIGRGVGAVGSFIAEHPGQAWDMGFELARDEFTGWNLATNLALGAATVFTGGGSGAALAARLGTGALRAARAVDEFSTGARITRAALGAGRAVRESEAAIGIGRAASEVGKVANKAVDVLGYVPQQVARARGAIPGMSEFGLRGTIADRAIASQASIQSGEAGMLRGALSDVVRGSHTRPGITAASSSGSRAFADTAYSVNRSRMYQALPGKTERSARFGEELYQAKKDPLKYGMEHGGSEVLQKAGSFAAKRAAKGMFGDNEERETPTYVSADRVYQPAPDTPDLGMGRGYGGAVGGGYAPDVSESTYDTSSGFAPIAVGRGRSFYEGAGESGGVVNPYQQQEDSYA